MHFCQFFITSSRSPPPYGFISERKYIDISFENGNFHKYMKIPKFESKYTKFLEKIPIYIRKITPITSKNPHPGTNLIDTLYHWYKEDTMWEKDSQFEEPRGDATLHL